MRYIFHFQCTNLALDTHGPSRTFLRAYETTWKHTLLCFSFLELHVAKKTQSFARSSWSRIALLRKAKPASASLIMVSPALVHPSPPQTNHSGAWHQLISPKGRCLYSCRPQTHRVLVCNASTAWGLTTLHPAPSCDGRFPSCGCSTRGWVGRTLAVLSAWREYACSPDLTGTMMGDGRGGNMRLKKAMKFSE